ncbi:GH36-type glycosyl hydrolase domain-containing protein [Vibrio aestuarianus]|uniref:GH36-type glycosyl hydrolase domain-containing protein n=1 Tax=Vibrio aestuarianus TaxID=28171 RepID=UPI0021C42E34|nr:cellobiose phosphorylase [Vibrio aestuarianus]MDE1210703.1 cellobiose phosphorylase [Vibrio aestuarianus]MDE1253400.1 cellobiose phosphorylase [Vibrio aestuarianus]MDE1319465.1 cellobiose phosphorylase [Vibrio aestuarianus]CAH8242413.1 sugar phosphorylase [Vibrio aestuarianus]
MHHVTREPQMNIGDESLTMTFHADGVLGAIRSDKLMVSLFDTPASEMAIANVFLRVKDGDEYAVTPLLFFNNNVETFKLGDNSISWVTVTERFTAQVTVRAGQYAYFYDVNVTNLSVNALTFDLIYGQDIGLADEGVVKTNELYCSQYIDHQVLENEAGYVVCSRQNLPQSSGNPRIQIGALSPVVGFSTDGFQFFGKEFKLTGEVRALQSATLENKKYQYEMGYIALQTGDVCLAPNSSSENVFYGVVSPNCTESNDVALISLANVSVLHQTLSVEGAQLNQPLACRHTPKPAYLKGEQLSDEEMRHFFGEERSFADEKNGELLSFFYGESYYVTLPQKEKYLERMTGHVIATGNNQDYQQSIMSSTHYIGGVFNSQLTLGNTSFNKLLGVCRNPLNQFTHAGQRIWVKHEGNYQPLGMPSAYETGHNYSRWIYKLMGGCLEVVSFSSAQDPVIQLDITKHGIESSLDIAISHQLIFGNNEGESHIEVVESDGQWLISGRDELIGQFSPELHFAISVAGAEMLAEMIRRTESDSIDYLVLKGELETSMSVSFGGKNQSVDTMGQFIEFDSECALYQHGIDKLTKGFNVHFSHDQQNSDRINTCLQWFTHNALVHYATPHGLEQYSGAAWGTRDVSQGPFELFMSMQEFGKAKAVLQEIYSHQYQDTGTWPQWFMFDQYATIQQEESHGDIVVWPLKALADYLNTTGDMSILDVELQYTSVSNGFAKTEQTYSLIQHVKRQVQHIIDNLVPGTSLSCYGDGDWDDTLQPANQSLRENMVSGWTIPLTLQALKGMCSALQASAYQDYCQVLAELSEQMEQDYHHYLIKDDVIAGFIHFDRDEQGEVKQIEHLLHPSDEKTGIHYRLLPASRSIISEVFSLEMAQSHMGIIKQNLVHPDGVRLMDKMAEYKAGKQSYFKRAELAANLGREVGLQYCHAHIRFIEALCKMGDAEAVFDNLYKIIPVGIQDHVPNAELRQSNAYFSSSDAKFDDRPTAYENFERVKSGEVAVKGGWRIYSSGPGIYVNQLIANVFGVRFSGSDLTLDPVISPRLGQVSVKFELDAKPIELVINSQQGAYTPKTIKLNGESVPFEVAENRYRTGGACISRGWLNSHLDLEENVIHITL